jgi:outer membrane protein assembly factor BamB
MKKEQWNLKACNSARTVSNAASLQSKRKRYLLPIITILIITLILTSSFIIFITNSNKPDSNKPNIPTINPPYTTPQLLWTQTIEYPFGPIGSEQLVVANNVIYVPGQNNGLFTALNATDHTILWTRIFAGRVSTPVIIDDIVYLQTNVFFALNATDATTLWTYPAQGCSSPTTVDGIVYFSSEYLNNAGNDTQKYGVIFALNAATGEKIWNYTTKDSHTLSSPAVANNIVYITSIKNNTLYALDAKTGKLLWKSPITASYDSSPTVANGIVYVGSENHNLYALNATTGKKIWTYKTTGNVGTPVVEYDVVYVYSDNKIYALNAATGKKIWNSPTNGKVSMPTITKGIIYISGDSDNPAIYALSAATGEQLWNYPLYIKSGTGAYAVQPVVIDDIVYACFSTNIYAFSTIEPL